MQVRSLISAAAGTAATISLATQVFAQAAGGKEAGTRLYAASGNRCAAGGGAIDDLAAVTVFGRSADLRKNLRA